MKKQKPHFVSVLIDNEILKISHFEREGSVNNGAVESRGIKNFTKSNIKKAISFIKDTINPTDIVLVLPQNITIKERALFIKTGHSLGFNNITTTTKAEAVALDYEYQRLLCKNTNDKKIIVFNIDKYLIDCSIFNIGEGVIEISASEWLLNYGKLSSRHISKIFKKIIDKEKLDCLDEKFEIIINGDKKYFSLFGFLFTKYPKVKFTTNDKINEKYSRGGYIRNGILNGEITNLLPLELINYSIGFLNNSKNIKFVFNKNTTIPCIKEEIINLNSGNLQYIDIYEGLDKSVTNCWRLTRLKIKNSKRNSITQVKLRIHISPDYNIGLQLENIKTGEYFQDTLFGVDYKLWSARYSNNIIW